MLKTQQLKDHREAAVFDRILIVPLMYVKRMYADIVLFWNTL